MDLQGSMHVWNVSLIIVCSDDDGDKCVLLAMMVLQPRCTLKALNNVSNAGVCLRVSSQQCCVQWVSHHILHSPWGLCECVGKQGITELLCAVLAIITHFSRDVCNPDIHGFAKVKTCLEQFNIHHVLRWWWWSLHAIQLLCVAWKHVRAQDYDDL